MTASLFSALFLAACAGKPPKPEPLVQVDKYEGEIERLSSLVEEQRNEIERLSASVEALQAVSAPKRAREGAPAAKKTDGPQVKVSTISDKPDPKPTVTMVPREDTLMSLYYRAQERVAAKDYEQATSLLDRFLKLAPAHVYADRAENLLVDVCYASGEYARLIELTKDFEAKYPSSFLVPRIIYQRGLAYLQMGQKNFASAHFDQLMKRFPESRFAELSAEQLNHNAQP